MIKSETNYNINEGKIYMGEQLERLQKVIAQSGITSRRKAEQFILDGRVKVNGTLVTTLGTKVSQSDEVSVDDVPIDKEKHVYYVLNKPRRYITSLDDEAGRETVIDLLEDVTERIYPIGRLDYNTSGILLLTNDGDFAHLLMHPKHEIEKEYIVKVEGIAKREVLDRMLKGVRDEGDVLKAIHFKVMSIDKKKKTMILRITLHEGKNRHIRRMLEGLGHPVIKIKREKYGSVDLGTLQPGEYRPLTKQEITSLKNLATKNVKQ